MFGSKARMKHFLPITRIHTRVYKINVGRIPNSMLDKMVDYFEDLVLREVERLEQRHRNVLVLHAIWYVRGTGDVSKAEMKRGKPSTKLLIVEIQYIYVRRCVP